MEAELRDKFSNIQTKLISSGGGVFEVMLNGNLIFSKKEKDRFPNDGEIFLLIGSGG